MKRVFFDANVLLDLLDEKRKGHRDARLLKDAIQETRARSSCSWHTLSILDYLVTSDSAGFAKSPVEVLTARKCAARLRPAPRH